MPALNSKLHTWQHNQLGNGHGSLNAKIQKELAENEGRTVWSDRRERLDNCVAQKKHDTLGNKWESKCTLSSKNAWGCLRKEPGYIFGFRKDTTFLKNEIGFSIIGDFKKIWNCAKTICLVRV